MTDEVSDGNGEPTIKVVDRRRFRPDGDVIDPGQPEEELESTLGLEKVATGAQAELEAKLVQQAARIDDLSRAYAALMEDNKAFRARLEREKERVLEAERRRMAQALLDTADEIERALAAMTGATAPSESTQATLVEGIHLTLAGLAKRIAELGAQRLEIVGQRFDPHLAEAVDAIPVIDAAQDEIILQEVRSGYRLGDRILRPARVRVGRLVRV